MAVMAVATFSKFIAHMGQVLIKFNSKYAILIIFTVLHSMHMSRLVIHVVMHTFKRLLVLGQIQ
jgi:hypothetical protein